MVAVDPAREISQLRIVNASGQESGTLKVSAPPTVDRVGDNGGTATVPR